MKNEMEEITGDDAKAALARTGLDIVIAGNARAGSTLFQAAHGNEESIYVLVFGDNKEATVWRCTVGDKAERKARAAHTREMLCRRFGASLI